MKQLRHDDRVALLRAYVGERANRRHKPGRAFERIDYRFDVLSDYGAFRDLQRHRMLTIEWQRLTPRHGYVRPDLIDDAGQARRLRRRRWTRSAALFDALEPEFPEQAPYAVAMAYRIRYVMQCNAREAMHLLELRTAPQGHPPTGASAWRCTASSPSRPATGGGRGHGPRRPRRARARAPGGRTSRAPPQARDA